MGRMMSKADMLIRTEMHTIGGKKKPVQILHCTERNCKTRFKTSIPTTPELVVHQAREKGWLINLSNKSCLCPEHSVKKEEPIVTTQLTKPREMSPEDRRRIFREIDENYVAKSYIEDVTDKTIGEKLTVPWAWVAKIREENFGPEGEKENKQVKFLKSEIERLTKKTDDLDNDVIRISERADDMRKEVSELKGRLDEYLRSAQ